MRKHVNEHIGELAIHAGGRDFVFRPLFCRVAELGSPREILELVNESQVSGWDGFVAAYQILITLADDDHTDEDLEWLLGRFFIEEGHGLQYEAGQVDFENIHILGSKIIRDATIGRPSNRDMAKAKSSKPSKEFDPAEFVAIGDAHLGGVNWWNKTMIELQKACKAKTEDGKEEDSITHEEITNLYDYIDKRKTEKGVK